ncbi:IclR family transcriptional regulator [Amycolatopsis alkalitolerans]|uniref:Glycerol operon regulatory protein n=1 Tax=Amycolatopsis alkalitolerans TaxID=2547244 RepID=A0A5C4M2Q1_9PSEU|nr:IclR family transcriptional regulator [Amycolatopsis alkalitolerans]
MSGGWTHGGGRGVLDAVADNGLRSVTIAMDVLECFTSTEENGASDIARRLGIAKSTASRMLSTLASGGLLERRAGGRYRLGLRLFEYGQLATDRLLLKEIALPALADLRDRLSETVQLGIPLGAEVLYVDRLEGTHGLRFHTEAFRRVPGHSSSSGKAIAAFNPFVAQAVLNAGFCRHTPYTVVDPERYRTGLIEIRERGWACSEEQFEVGLSSVAAPILVTRNGITRAVGAISVAGPTSRVLGARKDTVVTSVLRVTRKLSATLSRVDVES